MPDLQTLLNKFLASLYGGFGTGVSYNPQGVINSQIAAVSNGTTVETDLLTYTLPAGALSANGMGVRITAWGVSAANGNTKTVRLYFGSTLIASQIFTSSGTAWITTVQVLRVTATTQTVGGFIATALFVGNPAAASPTETLANAVIIKVTGQSATAGGDVTSAGFLVEALP